MRVGLLVGGGPGGTMSPTGIISGFTVRWSPDAQ